MLCSVSVMASSPRWSVFEALQAMFECMSRADRHITRREVFDPLKGAFLSWGRITAYSECNGGHSAKVPSSRQTVSDVIQRESYLHVWCRDPMSKLIAFAHSPPTPLSYDLWNLAEPRKKDDG
jgi:hypothetical protein